MVDSEVEFNQMDSTFIHELQWSTMFKGENKFTVIYALGSGHGKFDI